MEKVDYSNKLKDEEAARQAFLHNWELHTQILQSMFREAPPARPILAVTEVLLIHVRGLYDVIGEVQVQVAALESQMKKQ
jgi:hypothetical protein